jgi:hypothetical protein
MTFIQVLDSPIASIALFLVFACVIAVAVAAFHRADVR